MHKVTKTCYVLNNTLRYLEEKSKVKNVMVISQITKIV